MSDVIEVYFLDEYLDALTKHKKDVGNLNMKAVTIINKIEEFMYLKDVSYAVVHSYYDKLFEYLGFGDVLKKTIGKISSKYNYYDDLYILELQKLYDLIVFDNREDKIRNLVKELQNSTVESEIGGSVFTKYKCSFCECDDLWGSTNTPKICHKCSLKMSLNLIYRKVVC